MITASLINTVNVFVFCLALYYLIKHFLIGKQPLRQRDEVDVFVTLNEIVLSFLSLACRLFLGFAIIGFIYHIIETTDYLKFEVTNKIELVDLTIFILAIIIIDILVNIFKSIRLFIECLYVYLSLKRNTLENNLRQAIREHKPDKILKAFDAIKQTDKTIVLTDRETIILTSTLMKFNIYENKADFYEDIKTIFR